MLSVSRVRLIEDGGGLAFAFAGGEADRPVPKPLSDIPARRAWMAKQGIDRQIVGGWSGHVRLLRCQGPKPKLEQAH